MVDYIPVFLFGGVACAALRKVHNMLAAAAEGPLPNAPGGPSAPAPAPAAAAARPTAPAVERKQGDTSVVGQQAAAQQAMSQDMQIWLLTFQGTHRDKEYDRALKQLYGLRTHCKDEGRAVDEASRHLESVVVGAQKMADQAQPPTKAIRALLEIKYLQLGSELDRMQDTIQEPHAAKEAARIAKRVNGLAQRYFQYIVGRCLTAP